MAKKTNTEIKSKSGKSYEYYSIRRKVGKKKNKAGKWVTDYRLFYGSSKKEAKEKYQEYIKTVSLDSKKPFGEIAEWYIENVFSVNDKPSGNTKTLYINAYKSVFENSKIAGQPLKDVTGADLQDVISAASVKPTTVHQSVKLVRRLYRYLASQHVAPDVTWDLSLPAIPQKKQDQTIETFTYEELHKFIHDTPKDHRLRLLVILAINTGARIGELLALTYDDISGDQIRINKALQEVAPVRGSGNTTELVIGSTKTKTSSVRSIPINESVVSAIEDHKKWHFAEMEKNGYNSLYVFTTATGQLYFKSTIRKAYTRLCKSLEIEPKGFHTFRHTFGSRLAKNGVKIQTVSKLLGHDNIITTSKYYVNVDDQEKKTAIKALGLSEKCLNSVNSSSEYIEISTNCNNHDVAGSSPSQTTT